MLDLIQITNDPAMARRCDALEGMRLLVDLERLGKAERQAGRDTFISRHTIDDVARVRDAVRRSRLMVRVNPLHDRSAQEVEAVLAQGPDLLMLPMFQDAVQLREFTALVAGRAAVVALLETRGAVDTLDQWVGAPGLHEVFVGSERSAPVVGLALHVRATRAWLGRSGRSPGAVGGAAIRLRRHRSDRRRLAAGP